jgi:beta-phosphoglucomutase-like phosphatase (HAD superfamily)
MAIRAVFLDVDGTTVDTEPRNRKAIELAASLGGHKIQKEDWNHLAGQGDDKIWAQIASEKPDFTTVFNNAVSFQTACMYAKLKLIEDVHRIEETASAIELFRENKVDMAPVSNSIKGDAGASLKQAGYKKSDWTFSLFRDEIQAMGLQPKPAKDPYIEAMKRMSEVLRKRAEAEGTLAEFKELTPEECLVLEDSFTGARAGLNAGMHTIQMTDETPALPEFDVQGLEMQNGGHYYPIRRAELVDQCKTLLSIQPG